MGIFSQIYSARFINAESFIEEMLLSLNILARQTEGQCHTHTAGGLIMSICCYMHPWHL
jgi:hypothetical protein